MRKASMATLIGLGRYNPEKYPGNKKQVYFRATGFNMKRQILFLCVLLLAAGCKKEEKSLVEEPSSKTAQIPNKREPATYSIPDLDCNAVWLEPYFMKVNDAVSLKFTVRNLGLAPINYEILKIEFYVDSLLVYTYDGYVYISARSNLTFTRDNAFFAPDSGTHHFKLLLDPDNRLAEGNEENNTFEGQFEVYKPKFYHAHDQFVFSRGIHKNDLKKFSGKILTTQYDHPEKIVTNTFIEYSLTQPLTYFTTYQSDENYSEIIVGVGFYGVVMKIPQRQLVITMLMDSAMQYGVLAFWKIRGDSLYFDFYDTHTYDTTDLEEYAFFPDSSLLIVISSGDGDAGDVWGSYEFVRYEKDRVVENILKKSFAYSRDDTEPDTTLNYDLTIDENKHPVVQFIQTYYRSTEYGIHADSTYLGAEAFNIDLWELVTQNAHR